MEYLSEEHAKLLLTKEWIAKTDSESTTPYLMKFYSSTVDLSCCIMITDTKNVWGEVLSSNQFSRRWRDCNQQSSNGPAGEDDEEWSVKCLEFVAAAHTIGGVAELSFERVKSTYSDLAFTLAGEAFRWRWETFNVGPRLSADILSKHLILPLISMTHLAFSSADPLSTMSETELEKAVDKVGRTARRTLDTHVKNALSRPILATSLRRTTAMFNFVPDLPRIVVDTGTPDLTPPSPPVQSRVPPPLKPPESRIRSPSPPLTESSSRHRPNIHDKPVSVIASITKASKSPPPGDESVTEEEPEEDYVAVHAKSKAPVDGGRSANVRDSSPQSVPSKRATPDQSPPPKSRDSIQHPAIPPSSSPLPLPKKAKRAPVASSSSDEDSEEERKKHVARVKGASTRGAKQPLKRGGKRF